MSKRILYNISSANLQAANISGGTVSVTQKLDVNGRTLNINGNAVGAFSENQQLFGWSGSTTGAYMHTIKTRHNGGANDIHNALDFYVWQTSDAVTSVGTKHVMSATSVGVGINTTSPGYNLDVNGSFRSNSTGVQTFVIGSESGTTNHSMYLLNTYGNFEIAIAGGAGSFSTSAIAGDTVLRHSKNMMIQNGSGNSYLYLTSSGNIGINTASPGAKLQVDGPAGTGTNGSVLITGRDSFGHSLYVASLASHKRLGFNNDGTTANIFAFNYGASTAQNLTLQYAGGYVGIGTTAPSRPLHVQGAARLGGSGPALDFGDDFTTQIYRNATTSEMRFNTNSIERITITSTGNVGIGTTSPIAKLSVVGSETSANGGNSAIYIQNTAATSGNAWYLRAGAVGNNTPAGGFSIADGSGYKMIITSVGNVGIGTTAPAYKLQVNGDISFPYGSAIYVGGQVYPKAIESVWQNSQDQLVFYTPGANSNTAKLCLQHNGNVGIGTTSPNMTLDVNGGIHIRAGTAPSGGGATNQGVYLSWNESGGVGESILTYTTGAGSDPSFIIRRMDLSGGTKTDVCRWFNDSRMIQSGNLQVTGSITTNDISATGQVFRNVSYGYLNYLGGTGTAAGNNGYSVWATYRIGAGEFNAISDERIKNNIEDVNDETALITIRQIQPKKYNYIDKVTRTSRPVWGFLAQQVESVLDYSVNKIPNYIPNIYSKANVTQNTEGTILTLQSGTTNVLDNTKSVNGILKLKIFTDDNIDTYIETNVKTIISTTQLQIEEILSSDITEVFIYGQEVNDFCTLNKDAIFTVSVAALQEVDRQLQTAKDNITDLQNRVAQLEAAILNN